MIRLFGTSRISGRLRTVLAAALVVPLLVLPSRLWHAHGHESQTASDTCHVAHAHLGDAHEPPSDDHGSPHPPGDHDCLMCVLGHLSFVSSQSVDLLTATAQSERVSQALNDAPLADIHLPRTSRGPPAC